ncbi:MAG: TIGR03086 family metal-binding protein [Acidimicrobiales bacterium]
MDALEALERSRAGFGRRLEAVESTDWARSTPCSEFTVRDLANHVVAGCRVYTLLLSGAPAAEAVSIKWTDKSGPELLADWTVVGGEMMAGFRAPGALSGIVHHPAGDLPGEMLAGMRVTEFTLHGWDIARTVGGDEALDTGVVEWLLPVLTPRMPEFVAAGYFRAPSGPIGDDAPPQAKLLHLTGRHP